MLEKIGLPAKPSLRGRAWVVDASHCQGCSSQFTFINRKHHCRRCGGIFCNTCTQKRMVLRGQGDSPVRICEPCKTLEEAARFEARYGHKNKVGSGSSRSLSKPEDEFLNQTSGNDAKRSLSALKSNSEMGSRVQRPNNTSLRISTNEIAEETQKSPVDEPNHSQDEIESASPEKLRQQALDEKKKYKTLKGEGKPEEALKAFKRGKELERQADALELSIRKNRRKVLLSGNTADVQSNDNPSDSIRKRAPLSQVSKEKDDFLSELKDLGWTDTDLHGEDKKPASMTIEGELSSLLGEISQKPKKDVGTSGIDKTQIVAHKRKALALKRAGNLTEAKEELKKAKILEKELEERELLGGGAEDSDDELSAMINSMDDDKEDDLIGGPGHGSSFDHLLGTVGDFNDDRAIEVTDDDLMDPEIAAALHSIGWADEFDSQQTDVGQSVPVNRESLLGEINSLKKEAVNKKKAGNIAEAMALLKKAKLLEKEMASPVSDISIPSKKETSSAPKNRQTIQKELLALKKKALALRREGKLDEADKELEKGRVLEQQLEEMDTSSKVKSTQVVGVDTVDPDLKFDRNMPAGEVEADVTDDDLHDPAYLSLLNNLGWKEDEESSSSLSKPLKEDDNRSITLLRTSNRSKGEIQRELLGLKRKALTLRREGKIDEAEEVLESAKELETQMEEIDKSSFQAKSNTSKDDSIKFEEDKTDQLVSETSNPCKGDNKMPRSKGEIQRELLGLKRKALALRRQGNIDEAEELLESAKVLEAQLEKLDERENKNKVESKDEGFANVINLLTGDDQNDIRVPAEKRDSKVNLGDESVSSSPENLQERELKPQTDKTSPTQSQNAVQQEILARKRKALALKREGKLSEAREELRQAKLLEKNLESESISPEKPISKPNSAPKPSISPEKPQIKPNSAPKPSTGRDRFKLQQESLKHKRQALKLRREGRMEEAEAEFELAKNLEIQLEEMDSQDSNKMVGPEDDLGVEDFLDPQLLSALKSLGIENGPQVPEKVSPAKGENVTQERVQLEEQIKAEKVKALNLKRSGKQGEALEALRRAKLYEKKLNSLASA